MERIRLSKDEKTVLRLLYGACGVSAYYPAHVFSSCVRSLELKGLAKGAWTEGGTLEDARITDFGKYYIAVNPRLRNPVDWGVIVTLVAVVSAMASIAALFVACSHK